jgi:hypothetical protein
MIKAKLIFSILIIFLASVHVHCQEAELPISKKEKIRIKLSDRLGNYNIPDSYYDEKDSVYYSVEMLNGDVFSKGWIVLLAKLGIEQDGRKVLPGKIKSILDSYQRPKTLVLSYHKASIDFYKPFEIKYDIYTTGPVEIPIKYWPRYHEFMKFYESGKELNEQQKYIESYKQLENVLPGKQNNSYFRKFSDYTNIIKVIIPNDIEITLDKFEDRLDLLKTFYIAKEEIETSELDKIGLNVDTLNLYKELFNTFYSEIQDSKPIDLSLRHTKLQEDYNNFYKDCKTKWKTTMLQIFESGVYGRENEFTVYTNLIARLLCYHQEINPLSSFDSIDVSLVVNRSEVAFVKKYIDLLYQTPGWEKKFLSIVRAINDEIKTRQKILPTSHLNNLNNQINSEEQPNFYVFSAFDELAKGRNEGFVSSIELALAKCTNKEMLFQLELCLFSNNIENQKISKDVLENINRGMESEARSKPMDAIDFYEKAARLNDKFALPNFLMGRVEYGPLDNAIGADVWFNDAISKKDDFASARIYHLEYLIESQQYKDALVEISAILNNSYLNIWYIHFLKAKILYKTNDFAGALFILNGTCGNFTKTSFEQFMLTGDCYLALNKCEEARTNYTEAGKLRRNDPDYSAKIKVLNEKCKQ